MSDTTLEKFRLPGAGSAASEYDAERDDFRAELLRSIMKLDKRWLAIPGAAEPAFEFGIGPLTSLAGATSARRALLDVLVLDRDEDGDIVVADALGVAFGVAPTFHDAATQWEEAAREHLEDLQLEEHRLHPRLEEQLTFLRKIFG